MVAINPPGFPPTPPMVAINPPGFPPTPPMVAANPPISRSPEGKMAKNEGFSQKVGFWAGFGVKIED
jgi:hypothetical protein